MIRQTYVIICYAYVTQRINDEACRHVDLGADIHFASSTETSKLWDKLNHAFQINPTNSHANTLDRKPYKPYKP